MVLNILSTDKKQENANKLQSSQNDHNNLGLLQSNLSFVKQAAQDYNVGKEFGDGLQQQDANPIVPQGTDLIQSVQVLGHTQMYAWGRKYLLLSLTIFECREPEWITRRVPLEKHRAFQETVHAAQEFQTQLRGCVGFLWTQSLCFHHRQRSTVYVWVKSRLQARNRRQGEYWRQKPCPDWWFHELVGEAGILRNISHSGLDNWWKGLLVGSWPLRSLESSSKQHGSHEGWKTYLNHFLWNSQDC